MAINITELTRGWIKYLKNNRIVKGTSDPKTGKLIYVKQPNVQNLIKYLRITDEFDEDTIRSTIKKVLSAKMGGGEEPGQEPEGQKALPGKEPGSDVSTWQHTEITPGQRQEKIPQATQATQSQQARKKYNTDDAEDVQVKQPPGRLQGPGTTPRLGAPAPSPEEPPEEPRRKPRFKYRNKVQEAFYDRAGVDLSEEDVEAVFRALLTPQTSEPEQPDEEPEQERDPNEIKARNQATMRELKQMIREVMTPQQRKALWRALSEV